MAQRFFRLTLQPAGEQRRKTRTVKLTSERNGIETYVPVNREGQEILRPIEGGCEREIIIVSSTENRRRVELAVSPFYGCLVPLAQAKSDMEKCKS